MQNTRICLTARQLYEYRQMHLTLCDILDDIAELWPTDSLTVTCIARSPEEEAQAGGRTGIHVAGPPWRALDIRIKDLGTNYQRLADKVATSVNERWSYDPDRPQMKVAITKPHGSGPHMHCQVSPLTALSKSVVEKA